METISLKMEETLLKDIDRNIKKHRYSTRTELIRDAIRKQLSDFEKEEIIKKLTALKGSLKGKGKLSDEEAGELAFKKLAKKFNIPLE